VTVRYTFLVFGATGQTGHHFTTLALNDGHKVRVVVRDPGKMTINHDKLEVFKGSITEKLDLEALLDGVEYVVNMVGDVMLQRKDKINTKFMQLLIPAMRRKGVKRLLYQAGGFSRRPDQHFSLVASLARMTFARSYDGQHKDNEAVMKYLVSSADDIEWIVHRAAIGSDGPSRGVLKRSKSTPSVAPFIDCASYNYQIIKDESAIHTCDLSRYE
jgi:putative NADH-flavin reductase